MEKNLLYCGVDVDDKNFNVTLANKKDEELHQFKSRPTASGLIQKLNPFVKADYEIKICYEAGYLGFSLYRELKKAGFDCSVIAPGLTPKLPSDRIKTDKLDSEKLAKFFKNNLLTIVSVPDEVDESIRTLIRSRNFIKKEQIKVKQHIVSICRRLGWNYRTENRPKQTKAPWSVDYISWLDLMVKNCKIDAVKSNLEMLLLFASQYSTQLKMYDNEIIKHADSPKYKNKVEALLVYRGIDKIAALTLVSEFGDINRFAHPNAIVSYCGLDVKEYSSGGVQRQFGITKMGNPYLRTALVEISQCATKKPKISRPLATRRRGKNLVMIEIADRCMKRLYHKSMKMLFVGKHINKAKVACARELIGFIWESLKAVQA